MPKGVGADRCETGRRVATHWLCAAMTDPFEVATSRIPAG